MTPLYGLLLTCVAALYFAEWYKLRAKFACMDYTARTQAKSRKEIVQYPLCFDSTQMTYSLHGICFSIFWNSIFLLSIGIFKPQSHLIAKNAKHNKNLCWGIRMWLFCSCHPPVGKSCGGPHVTQCSHCSGSPKLIAQCSTTIPPIEKGGHRFLFAGLHEDSRVSRVTGYVARLQMFIHFISTQQSKRN